MILLKSAHEIQKISYVCQILAEILERIDEYVEEGITTKEIDRIIEEWIRQKNCSPSFLGYLDYPASACISINEEVVHGIPGPRRIVAGDIVSIDVGVMKDGFFSDAAVTIPVPPISEENKRLIDSTRRSLKAGIAEAKRGNYISDISKAVQSTVAKDGFSPVRVLVGHGVGKAVHEDPQIPNFYKSGHSARIQDGMVLAIEPMINVGTYDVYTEADGWTVVTEDGKPSAHFEHTIAVVDGKPRILTELS